MIPFIIVHYIKPNLYSKMSSDFNFDDNNNLPSVAWGGPRSQRRRDELRGWSVYDQTRNEEYPDVEDPVVSAVLRESKNLADLEEAEFARAIEESNQIALEQEAINRAIEESRLQHELDQVKRDQISEFVSFVEWVVSTHVRANGVGSIWYEEVRDSRNKLMHGLYCISYTCTRVIQPFMVPTDNLEGTKSFMITIDSVNGDFDMKYEGPVTFESDVNVERPINDELRDTLRLFMDRCLVFGHGDTSNNGAYSFCVDN